MKWIEPREMNQEESGNSGDRISSNFRLTNCCVRLSKQSNAGNTQYTRI
jgi:hypothetical protein